MASQQLAAVVTVSLTASMVSAYAAPCSSDIGRMQGRIEAQLAARAATASQKESTEALLHRQPTSKSVGAAQEKLRQESAEMVQIVERAMVLARAADAAGDKGACEQALADAQRAIARPKSGDLNSDDAKMGDAKTNDIAIGHAKPGGRTSDDAKIGDAKTNDIAIGLGKPGGRTSDDAKIGDAKINDVAIGHAKPDDPTASDTAIGNADAAGTRSADPKFYRERGMAFYRNGDLDRALADFDAAIQLDPRSASAYIDRSIVLYRKAEPDRAFADIAQAIRIEDSLKAAAKPQRAPAPSLRH